MTQYRKPFNGDYNITSPYGIRNGILHGGIDFALPKGTQVIAISNGIVQRAILDQYGGAFIDIKHDDGNYSRYLHLSKFLVYAGQRVNQGQVIGLSGGVPGEWGAGQSTGSHLHFEIHIGVLNNRVNPYQYIFPQIIQSNNSNNMFDFTLYHNEQGIWMHIVSGDYNGRLSIVRNGAELPAVVNVYTNEGHEDRLIVTAPLLQTEYTITAGNVSHKYSGHIVIVAQSAPQSTPIPVVDNTQINALQVQIGELNVEKNELLAKFSTYKSPDEINQLLLAKETEIKSQYATFKSPTEVDTIVQDKISEYEKNNPVVIEPVQIDTLAEFKKRSAQLMIFLGVIKNALPSLGTYLLVLGVRADRITNLNNLIAGGVSFLIAFILEIDKTNYNNKVSEASKTITVNPN